MMKEKTTSLLYIHVAVLLFGLAGLFGKWLTLPPTIIVLGRTFFATISLAAFAWFMHKPLVKKNWRDFGVFVVLGFVLAIHWTAFFQSVQLSTVAIGLLTFATFPVFVAFLEPYFFKEAIRSKEVALAVLTLIGVGLVVPSLDVSQSQTQGVLWGVFSGFTFAVLGVANRKYVKEYSGTTVAFYQNAFAALFLLPFLFLTRPTVGSAELSLLVLLGVVFTALSHSLFISGMRHVKAHAASVIASLEPVYGIIFAAVFLHEIPDLKTIAGGILILACAVYASKNEQKS